MRAAESYAVKDLWVLRTIKPPYSRVQPTTTALIALISPIFSTPLLGRRSRPTMKRTRAPCGTERGFSTRRRARRKRFAERRRGDGRLIGCSGTRCFFAKNIFFLSVCSMTTIVSMNDNVIVLTSAAPQARRKTPR